MRFQLIGVNHKTAPVEVRERLAIPESRLPEACKRLSEHPAVAEGMIVSTCNRVEFIANMKNGTGDLREFLRDYFEIDPSQFESHLYEFCEDEAVRHIFRVAASLDSMVVGEPQILGQVKEAYASARAVGAVRAQLDQLLTRAFAVAKRVRDNALRFGDAGLTGPVARGDAETVAAHVTALEAAPSASAAAVAAYIAMARLTADRALAAGLLKPADAERLLDVLGGRQ